MVAAGVGTRHRFDVSPPVEDVDLGAGNNCAVGIRHNSSDGTGDRLGRQIGGKKNKQTYS